MEDVTMMALLCGQIKHISSAKKEASLFEVHNNCGLISLSMQFKLARFGRKATTFDRLISADDFL